MSASRGAGRGPRRVHPNGAAVVPRTANPHTRGVARETRYAKSGDVHIAYQVVGSGPIDLVLIPGLFSHVEHQWEEPGFARFLERLASFSRLIVFDACGAGLSDRAPELPPMEEQMDDVLAVLEATGSALVQDRAQRVHVAGRADGDLVRRVSPRANESARPVRHLRNASPRR